MAPSYTLDIEQFAVLFKGDGDVIDCLLVALVVEVCLSDMAVRQNQAELRFSMREHQDLRECQRYLRQCKLVHSDVQNLLFVLAFEQPLQPFELLLQFLADLVYG